MSHSIPFIGSDNQELRRFICLRRQFHKYPETGFAEFITTCKICEILEELGFSLQYGISLYQTVYPEIEHISDIVKIDNTVVSKSFESARQMLSNNPYLNSMEGGFTGVIAAITCSTPGPTMGFRFDIDALPIKESSDPSHKPHALDFKSENNNMHACGHDGHISIGLGLARRIAENKDTLSGKFIFVFQPSEEGPSGGQIFSRFDCFKKMDYLIPLHIGIIDERKIVCGISFLSLKWLQVIFEGNAAHSAACPEKGKNALLAACNAVSNLFSISRHSEGVSRVNVGKFFSINPANVISDHVEFQVEVRGENNAISDYMLQRAKEVINGSALIQGVNADIKSANECISADNSEQSNGLLKKAAIKAGIGEDYILDAQLVPGSEDASYLMNVVQKHGGNSSYLCIGSPTYGGHHTPTFDFDEDMLLWGVKILWEFIGYAAEAGDLGHLDWGEINGSAV